MLYKFYATHNSVTTELNPLGFRKCKFSWEKKEDIFFRKKLTGKIIFGNDPFKTNDYTFFKTIEDGANKCLKISFEIKRSCDKGLTYSTYWNGYFGVNDGKFDLDRCLFEVEPQVEDDYKCLIDSESVERNILNVASVISTKTISGTINTLTCNRTVSCVIASAGPYYCGVGTFPADQGWCLYGDIVTPLGVGGLCTQVTTWIREEISTACVGGFCVSPGGTWIFIDNNCGVDGTCLYARCPVSIVEIFYENNRLLYDVFLYFINQNCPSITGVISDFFEWNPPGTAPGYTAGENYVTGDINKVNYLTISQKSDIIDPTATEPATVGMTTFKKLTGYLKIMFNVYWFIESGKLRFEHISYFSQGVGFDLTTTQYAKYISGTRKYEYLKLKMPKYEKWKWMEARNLDFVGMDIYYDSFCVNQNSLENEKTYVVDEITTDLPYIQGHPEDISKQGFVIISNSFDGTDYTVNSENGLITLASVQNGHLSWANLHYNYHRHGRVLLSGNMNGATTSFFTALATRKQVPVTFPLCCADNFDPDQLIVTGLGNGKVESAELSIEDNFITASLYYD
jgi:hypothetical protein